MGQTYRLNALFQDMAQEFHLGDFDRLSQRMHTPSAVYFDDTILVLKTPAMLRQALLSVHTALTHLGRSQTDAQVVAIGLPKRHNLMAVARWTHRNAEGQIISTSLARHYFDNTAGQPGRQQIMEYLAPPVAHALKDLPRMAA